MITQTEVCVDQLDPIFSKKSLELSVVPSYFKRSTIIPDPKTAYRPVALTSVVIKCFKRLVLAYLKDTGSLLDIFQFAYRSNRSLEDAVNMVLHYILEHLGLPKDLCTNPFHGVHLCI